MPDRPFVTIVLGSYNRLSFLKATLETIRLEAADLAHEIIVVDGGSTDGTLSWLVRQKDVITIIQHNRGVWRGQELKRRSWGYFMNLAFKCAQGKYILMLSDDTLLVPGSLKKGIDRFESLLAQGQKIGAMAFYWRNWPEQADYWVGLTLGNKMFVNHGLYLRSALEDVGWLDEDNYQFYHADADVCLRMWQIGYSVVDSPDSFVEHSMHAATRVRATNQQKDFQDWETHLSRWEGIYYSRDENNIGGWLYRTYVDPIKTVSRFPRHRLMRLKADLKSVLRPYLVKYVRRKRTIGTNHLER